MTYAFETVINSFVAAVLQEFIIRATKQFMEE